MVKAIQLKNSLMLTIPSDVVKMLKIKKGQEYHASIGPDNSIIYRPIKY